jgi:hypothetical protein
MEEMSDKFSVMEEVRVSTESVEFLIFHVHNQSMNSVQV